MTHRDPQRPGLARRRVLGLLGGGAGMAVAAAYLPAARRIAASRLLGPDEARAGGVPCVVRPELTEGPFFVDENLLRSDIRSDPSDGSVRDGTPLRLDLVVSHLDGSICAPFPGVVVDVWHCDAAGDYSDVEATQGKKFLRGHQITDADGRVSFITIYPGWYPGRTVHIHFKLRTDPTGDSGLEFTSQLFFGDALSDAVFDGGGAYAGRPERDVRNADDGIYLAGGSELIADVTSDGAGGYTATFALALEATGVTTTTTVGEPSTTTTLPPAACATIAACLATLAAALPAPELATTRRERRTARRLAHRLAAVRRPLERAATASGGRQARLYDRVRARLAKLLDVSRRADEDGVLGIPHDPIEEAVGALIAAMA
jgi:protocatechuate 3,4-dioxygenase beta subunit